MGSSQAIEAQSQRAYMTIGSVARWADVSNRTVRRWLVQGLPYRQPTLRGRILIRPEDLHSFLAHRQTTQAHLTELVDEVFNDFIGKKRR
jgi:hypothetical protein